jgi:dodecin
MATQLEERTRTSVAKVIEISSESSESFEDAIQHGIAKAADSVHGIRSAWVANQQVTVEDGKVVAYRVDLKVTFVLD